MKPLKELIYPNGRNEQLQSQFEFRSVDRSEAEQIVEIEHLCFPEAEACSRRSMFDKIELDPDTFLVAVHREQEGKIAGFLNGISTDEMYFRDEFFTDARLHSKDGKNLMLLSLNVHPEQRGRGLARELMYRFLAREQLRREARMNVQSSVPDNAPEIAQSVAVLTCHTDKIPMYRGMGFELRGRSASTWGGGIWNEMALELSNR